MEKDILSIFYQNKGILSISLKAPLDGSWRQTLAQTREQFQGGIRRKSNYQLSEVLKQLLIVQQVLKTTW